MDNQQHISDGFILILKKQEEELRQTAVMKSMLMNISAGQRQIKKHIKCDVRVDGIPITSYKDFIDFDDKLSNQDFQDQFVTFIESHEKKLIYKYVYNTLRDVFDENFRQTLRKTNLILQLNPPIKLNDTKIFKLIEGMN